MCVPLLHFPPDEEAENPKFSVSHFTLCLPGEWAIPDFTATALYFYPHPCASSWLRASWGAVSSQVLSEYSQGRSGLHTKSGSLRGRAVQGRLVLPSWWPCSQITCNFAIQNNATFRDAMLKILLFPWLTVNARVTFNYMIYICVTYICVYVCMCIYVCMCVYTDKAIEKGPLLLFYHTQSSTGLSPENKRFSHLFWAFQIAKLWAK